MNAAWTASRPAFELLEPQPVVQVEESEYRRLLGYPRHHVPGDRARELSARARHWYLEHGRPWLYAREATLELTEGSIVLDGTSFSSRSLNENLRRARAQRALLVVVSAGPQCEEHARTLWQESKPDEYFFLEMFGSAVVEHLAATLNGRLCELADREGLLAMPHYSPGYTGWDVADQTRLFEVIARGRTQSFPEPLEVLPSGMLRPKKSLLAVVGLAARDERSQLLAQRAPCESCSLGKCAYRRAPYRHASGQMDGAPLPVWESARVATRPVPAQPARYSVNPRALKKWADERVRLEHRADGLIAASFRFDGTTCTNLGQALAFDYHVTLSPPEDGFRILEADCRPAPGDAGYTHMCAFLNDAGMLLRALATEKPLLGRPLAEVLSWVRPAAPSGCHCQVESRAHKWGLALEAMHFALAHSQTDPATPLTKPASPALLSSTS